MKIKKRIRFHQKQLDAMEGSLAELFSGMFSNDEIMFEYLEKGEIVQISYFEIKRMIFRVAKRVFEHFHHEAGDYIGLYCVNPIKWSVAFWAILMAGYKPFLVNQKLPYSVNKSFLETLKINGMFLDEKGISFGYPSLTYEEAIQEASSIESPCFAEEIILSTSGTSGQDKLVFYSGKALAEQVISMAEIVKGSKEIRRGYKGRATLLMFLPLYHIFGLSAMYLVFGFFGCTFALLSSYAPSDILNTVRRHKVTHIFAVPLLWHSMEEKILAGVQKKDEKTQKKFYSGIEKINKIGAKHPLISEKLAQIALKEVRSQTFGDSIRYCIAGGSSLRSSCLEIFNGIGYPLRNGYGATEIGITSVEVSANHLILCEGSIGPSCRGVEYKIEDGTLWVKSPGKAKGVLTKGVYEEAGDWFDTHDLAHFGKDHKVYIDGRKSDLIINSDGENINPETVENSFDLLAFPFVLDSCVSSVKEGDRDVLTYLFYLSKRAKKENIDGLISYLNSVNETLPLNYKIVHYYRIDKPLKEENDIKLSRAKIKEKLDKGFFALSTLEEKEKTAEKSDDKELEDIRRIFSEVLHKPLDEIGDDSHFMFDLGGTSMDYYSLIAEIGDRSGKTIDFDVNAPLGSPRDFAKALKEGSK